ncbi:MAG: hypothetical protein V1865_02925 [bacterium]
MKSRSGIKIGKQKGNPAYRTASVFKYNKSLDNQINRNKGISNKNISNKNNKIK